MRCLDSTGQDRWDMDLEPGADSAPVERDAVSDADLVEVLDGVSSVAEDLASDAVFSGDFGGAFRFRTSEKF